MNKEAILDASAVLAHIQEEKGGDIVDAAFDQGPCWITTVNYSEVLGKLCEKGMPEPEAVAAMADLRLSIVDFDLDLARRAAFLRPRTKALGLSLGDRACLALADRLSAAGPSPTVYTAEQIWTKAKWPFKVVVIRQAKDK